MIIWITGLSGAGKTTIGKALASKIKECHKNTLFLDGDIIRSIVGDNLGFDLKSRLESGWRICRLCKHLDDEKLIVVCSVISLFHEHQIWNRKHYSKYFEVFIDTPIQELKMRDPKGIYKAFDQGKTNNVAGLDLPFTKPINPDITIENTAPLKLPSYWAEVIYEKLQIFEPELV
jgi:adenylylsulfate kinase-like enzyme